MVDNRAERPLFIFSDARLRHQELLEFATNMSFDSKLTPLRDLEKEIARWHFRRHSPIPLVTGLTGLYIRPFWRDRIKDEKIPPLPMKGRSGKIYKHGQKIPFWEFNY